MRDLVEYVVRGVVDKPDGVRVEERKEGKAVTLKVRVSNGDQGRVIGRQGRIIKALRTVAEAAAARSGKSVTIDLEE